MHNIQGGYFFNPGSTNQVAGAAGGSSRARLGHRDVDYHDTPQTHLLHAPSPEAEKFFEFVDVVTGDTHIAKNLDELLSYDQLLIRLRQSDGYVDYGQSVEQIASDIRSNDSLQPLLLAVNNINEIPVTREVPRMEVRDISISGFDLEDNSGSDTDIAPDRPFNEAMSNLANRARTFDNTNWRNVRLSFNFPPDVSDQDFIDSGFYSIYDWDQVQCFSCGGGLQNWRRDEKPDDVHAQKFPKCRFIRKKLGADLVDTIQNALTTEQRYYVARTIPGSRHLYCEPIGGQSNLQEAAPVRDYLSDSDDDLPIFPTSSLSSRARSRTVSSTSSSSVSRSRPHSSSSSGSSSPVSWLDTEHSANSRTYNQPEDINLSVSEAKLLLANIVNPDQMEKLNYLENKVNSAHLNDTYKEILNSLLKKPDLIGEIAGIIDSMLSGDCADHTAEVCDQIKVRFKAASLTEGICDQNGRLDWFRLLYKVKILLHEDQLVMALANYNLLEDKESTEIRGYLKNRLAEEVCEFTENHIKQRFPHYGSGPVSDIYSRLKNDFIRAINDKSLFKQYLVNICKDDSFLAFIRGHDEEFSQWLAKEESNFEVLMDDYDQNYTGASASSNEHGYIAASCQLRETREQTCSMAIQQFLGSKVDRQWDSLVLVTRS